MVFFSKKKNRRILVSESDSSDEEVESPVVSRRNVLGELSMNNSSQPVRKNRQLYINSDDDTDDDLDIVQSSD